MDPNAFSILGIGIRWYGILISCGILLGIIIAKYTCRVKQVDYNRFFDVVIISLVAGIIGARLYYVIFKISYYSKHVDEIIKIRNGGLAIHGGLLFGFLAAIIYIKRHELNFLKLADAAAPCIIIAQGIGRWGNFFNQEAYGNLVSYEFISHFPKFIQKGMFIDGVYYNPTFLYESLWNFSVFIILMFIIRKSRRDGLCFFTYIGLYSIGRYMIEGMRSDSLMLGPLKVAQIVSIIGIAAWLVFILRYYLKKSD